MSNQKTFLVLSFSEHLLTSYECFLLVNSTQIPEFPGSVGNAKGTSKTERTSCKGHEVKEESFYRCTDEE